MYFCFNATCWWNVCFLFFVVGSKDNILAKKKKKKKLNRLKGETVLYQNYSPITVRGGSSITFTQ